MNRLISASLITLGLCLAACDAVEQSADGSIQVIVHENTEPPPAHTEPADYDAILDKLRKPEVERPDAVAMGRAFGGRTAQPPRASGHPNDRSSLPRNAPARIKAFEAAMAVINANFELYRVRNNGQHPPFGVKGWGALVTDGYLDEPPVNALTSRRTDATRLVMDGQPVDGTVAWVYSPDDRCVKGVLPNAIALKYDFVPQDHKPGDHHPDFVTY